MAKAGTGFILDMQHKLYRWSVADPEKRFADLAAAAESAAL